MTSQVIDQSVLMLENAGMADVPTLLAHSQTTEPVTYVVQFDIKAEHRDAFLKMLGEVLDAMRDEPTFVEAILHHDPESPLRFMLYETWTSHDDVIRVQLQRPYRRAYHDALPEMLAADRSISMWQPMRADRTTDLPLMRTLSPVRDDQAK